MVYDPEQEYFSDGVSEDIITDLSKMSGLFVIARNSAEGEGRTGRGGDGGSRLGCVTLLEKRSLQITKQEHDGTCCGRPLRGEVWVLEERR